MKFKLAATAVAVLAGFLISTGLVRLVSDPICDGYAFCETFDGQPSQPTAFASAAWDIIIDGQDGQTVNPNPPPELIYETIQAGHGFDCSPPPFLHPISGASAIDGPIFICKDHMMTTVHAGYSVLAFRPRQPFDFAGALG